MTDLPSPLPPPDAWWRPSEINDYPAGPANRPPRTARPDLAERPFAEALASITANRPDAPCLMTANGRITYAGLARAVAARAAWLTVNSDPGDGIGIVLSDEAEILLTMLACLTAGRVALPWNAGHPPERLGRIAASARPRLIVADTANTARIGPSDCPVLPPTHIRAAMPPTGIPTDIHAPGLVIYTSGTTGTPRGFVRSSWQLLRRCDGYANDLRAGPDDHILTLFSVTNGNGLSAAHVALLSGAAITAVNPVDLGLRGLLQTIATIRPTLIWILPSLLRTLLALPAAGPAFASLRGCFLASEAALHSDIARWRQVLPADCVLATAYGMTEATGITTYFLPQAAPEEHGQFPAGYPSPVYDLAIVDDHGTPVGATGEAGHLWVRGPMVTKGQWLDGACVPGRAIPDPTDPNRRILPTGDIVRLRPDGRLDLAGRADAMVKIRGNRVEPAEIEDALRRLPGITDVAVLAQEIQGETALAAYIVRAHGQNRTEVALERPALIAHLRGILPSYMVPTRIVFLPALPRLPNGKIDAAAIAAGRW